jgi:CelD/BcsL family acetyltransferase involved in cellulose biosynthesis
MIYDDSRAAFSPGSTLLFLLIEDLIRQGSTLIDFGYGEPAYRHGSTNVLVERGTILLLRKTFANRLYQVGHATFRSVIKLLKHLRRGARSG